MSRRRAAEKREILPDPKFGDVVLTKFMNSLMYDGKKSTAETIVYGALDRIQSKSGGDPIRMFHDALGNVRPAIEVLPEGVWFCHRCEQDVQVWESDDVRVTLTQGHATRRAFHEVSLS